MKFRVFWLCILCCFFSVLAGEVRAEEIEVEEEGIFDWLKQDKFEIFGSLELEFHRGEDFGEAEEDISTSSNWDVSVDLGLAVQPKPWLSAELVVTWDDECPLEIDEAWVTLGNPEQFPLYLSGGKITLPFGRYETVMLSDSLPQEIGETKEEAALLGLEWHGLQMAVFAYDGDKKRGDAENGLSPYGADISYRLGEEELGFLVGASWVENLADSDGLTDFYHDEGLLLKDRVSGIAAYSQLTLGPFTLAGEYVESLERPKVVEDGEVARLDRQVAWAGELAVAFELSEIALVCGLTYGETSGVGDLLPKKRYGAAVSLWPRDYLYLVVEYLRDEDYSVSQGGTGKQADFFAIKLAAEF